MITSFWYIHNDHKQTELCRLWTLVALTLTDVSPDECRWNVLSWEPMLGLLQWCKSLQHINKSCLNMLCEVIRLSLRPSQASQGTPGSPLSLLFSVPWKVVPGTHIWGLVQTDTLHMKCMAQAFISCTRKSFTTAQYWTSQAVHCQSSCDSCSYYCIWLYCLHPLFSIQGRNGFPSGNDMENSYAAFSTIKEAGIVHKPCTSYTQQYVETMVDLSACRGNQLQA